MSNVGKVQNVSVAPVETLGGDAGAFGHDRNPEPPEPARYRLVIEEGEEAGSFIYKTLDTTTGEVVRQLPREEVLKLVIRPADTGVVIDTSV